jgi:hypothetical protein
MTTQWEAGGDHLTALGPSIRLRAADGWELHSWHIFTRIEGGGRISPYPLEMFYAVWKREVEP